jgi:uncharacterized protein with HEPN domain
MARRYDVVLEDILEAIDLAHGAVVGLNKEALAKGLFRQRGVERTLEIVSEAVRHLPDEMLASRPEILWPDVRVIGNLIRHEYWRIVEDDLPPLREAIAALLARLGK